MSPGGMMLGGGGTLIVLLLALLFKVPPEQLLSQIQQGGGGVQQQQGEYQPTPHEQELQDFATVVLGSTEDVWHRQFKAQTGQDYVDPTLVFFKDGVQSACGTASSAVGPFYCPGDEKLYIDLSFFDQLGEQFGAEGDFAQAYVIAHEVGHHIQKQLGISEQVDAMRQRLSEKEFNKLSVRMELQADFYAGVWAHYVDDTTVKIEPGDVEEALNAATQIGDDTLQREMQGRVVPDSFTHGTSAQRMRWFKLGYDTGDMSKGDTFSAKSL
jgi:predicted metalloprotease